MEAKHWNEEELVALLYGVGRGMGGGEDEHLAHCPECGARWNALRERRGAVLGPVSLPETLAAQRKREIMRRVAEYRERGVRAWFLAPRSLAALAVAALLLIAVAVRSPAPRQDRSAVAASAAQAADAKLFMDVMIEASRTEPAALMPVESLFEAPQKAERR